MSSRFAITPSAFRTYKTEQQLKNCVPAEIVNEWLYENKPHLLSEEEKQEVIELKAKRKTERKSRQEKIETAVKPKSQLSKRVCKVCTIVKPLDSDHFYQVGDGYRSVCKPCVKEIEKQRYQAKKKTKLSIFDQVKKKVKSEEFVGIDEFDNTRLETLKQYISTLRTKYSMNIKTIKAERKTIGWQLIVEDTDEEKP